MTDRMILGRYTGNGRKPDEPIESGFAPETDVADDFGAFGWLRGIRERSVMLELRRKDGNILAIGYGFIDRVEFDPSEGIKLSLAGREIRITGRNLNAEVRPTVRLFEGITRHRVSWVCEADARESLALSDNATVIDAIDW